MNYVSEALEQKVRALTFLYDCLKNPLKPRITPIFSVTR